MGTKSKRYSRSIGAKTVAFVLICLCACGTVFYGLQIYHQIGETDINITSDILFVSDYTQSENYLYSDYYRVSRELQTIAGTRVVTAEQKAFLNARVAYYIDDGEGFQYFNTNYHEPDQFTEYTKFTYIFDQGEYRSYYRHLNDSLFHFTPYDGDEAVSLPGLRIYFSFYPQYITGRQTAWTQVRGYLQPGIYIIIGMVVLALLLTVYLTFVTGRRREDDELHLSTLDRMYSDLMLVTLSGFCVAWGALILLYSERYSFTASLTAIWFATVVTALITPCILGLYLSLIRKLKSRRLLRHTLIASIFIGIFRLIRGCIRGVSRLIDMLFLGRRFRQYPFARAMFRRQANYLISSITIVFFFTLFALSAQYVWMLGLIAAELVITAHYVRANNNTYEDMERICAQVYEVYQGNMDFDPQVREGTQLYAASRQLLDIGEGMNRSMARQLASERTKIALVTNVSHDLKTPLTSIIGYIDLLSRDETLSPEARDYVTVLTNKSQRLKAIIEDLFDLAKTTGGDANLSPEVLDLRRLIEQTMVEMEDRITQSGQIIKAALPEAAVYTYADGRKLYRVIQNVLDNALKYSMPGTRIFITLSSSQTHGRIDFKNTASYEMNFTPEEILERFARGDEARTSEGSGLGLNIAEGFTRACGGEMKVSIDGDQFKLSLIFPLSPPPSELPEAEPEAEASPMLSAAEERGKIYRPLEDAPPQPVVPAPDDHFEPEKPVEITELESVLEAFDQERFLDESVAQGQAGDAKQQLKSMGRTARQKLGELGSETGEALEQLKEMFHIPGGGKKDAKESRWKWPKAFDKISAKQHPHIQEPDFEAPLQEAAVPEEELPEFIREFQELKAQAQNGTKAAPKRQDPVPPEEEVQTAERIDDAKSDAMNAPEEAPGTIPGEHTEE